MAETFKLQFRTQLDGKDSKGYHQWQCATDAQEIAADSVAVLVCDVWDRHHNSASEDRLNAMLARMNQCLNAARSKGALIIHSPSECIDFYKQSAARKRIQDVTPVMLPNPLDIPDTPLPIDDTDGGSDSYDSGDKPWTRQSSAIDIDEERDIISDQGHEIYSYLKTHGYTHLLFMGVHTNRCVMNRTFGIKNMVKWGISVAIIRDLTDSLYNPQRAPYVSHDEGTQLMIGYLEKFWCSSIASDDLI